MMHAELFIPPFNLAGEPLTSEPSPEGVARAKAEADAITRKAQLTMLDESEGCSCGFFHEGLCDE